MHAESHAFPSSIQIQAFQRFWLIGPWNSHFEKDFQVILKIRQVWELRKLAVTTLTQGLGAGGGWTEGEQTVRPRGSGQGHKTLSSGKLHNYTTRGGPWASLGRGHEPAVQGMSWCLYLTPERTWGTEGTCPRSHLEEALELGSRTRFSLFATDRGCVTSRKGERAICCGLKKPQSLE